MAMNESKENEKSSSLQRGIQILRLLSESPDQGLKLKEIADSTHLPQATAHRILKQLETENMVEQTQEGKNYRLTLDLFTMAAKAASHSQFRQICRPSLLRLSGALNDTVFLMVRSGFDAVCVDRVDGSIPIRSLTGDVGGRVPLGMGQAASIILALLPEDECEEVIRFNVPRLIHLDYIDEAGLRFNVAHARKNGYAIKQGQGSLTEMSGVSVGITDRNKQVVGALSIGTLNERLNADRLPHIVKMLQTEAAKISALINPYDPALRRPLQHLRSADT